MNVESIESVELGTTAVERGIVAAARGIALLALVLVAGCSEQEVTMHLDLLSFVDEHERASRDYALEPGSVLPAPLTIEPQVVDLVSTGGNLLLVEEVRLTLTMQFDHRAGRAHLLGAVYVGGKEDDTAGLYDGPPLVSAPLTLSSAGQATLVIDAASDRHRELVEIFESGAVHLGVALFVDALDSATAVSGSWEISALDALVVGNGDLLP